MLRGDTHFNLLHRPKLELTLAPVKTLAKVRGDVSKSTRNGPNVRLLALV